MELIIYDKELKAVLLIIQAFSVKLQVTKIKILRQQICCLYTSEDRFPYFNTKSLDSGPNFRGPFRTEQC